MPDRRRRRRNGARSAPAIAPRARFRAAGSAPAARRHALGHRFEIDLGLAGAGHAVEQGDRERGVRAPPGAAARRRLAARRQRSGRDARDPGARTGLAIGTGAATSRPASAMPRITLPPTSGQPRELGARQRSVCQVPPTRGGAAGSAARHLAAGRPRQPGVGCGGVQRVDPQRHGHHVARVRSACSRRPSPQTGARQPASAARRARADRFQFGCQPRWGRPARPTPRPPLAGDSAAPARYRRAPDPAGGDARNRTGRRTDRAAARARDACAVQNLRHLRLQKAVVPSPGLVQCSPPWKTELHPLPVLNQMRR